MATLAFDVTQLNPVYRPYLTDTHRYQIFFGGSSSGKSVFLATRAVLDVLQGRNILVARKVGHTLRASVWNEVGKAIDRLGIQDQFDIRTSEMTVTARANGAQILFAGLDDVEKIKSLTPARGALTDVWMEEATECDRADFKQLDKRLRGQTRHLKRVTMSFNPVYKTHWIYEDFFSGFADGDTSYQNAKVSILKTTYLDNRFLTEDDASSLRAETDPYYRAVYTLGDWGTLGDSVFTNWHTEDLRPLRRLYRDRYIGLDFGFARDPSAAVNCALDRPGRRVLVFDELYETGLVIWELARRLERFAGRNLITCDSADPRSIAELRALGVRALPARKGPDSVLHGLQWLQGHELVVNVTCHNLCRELSHYRWKKDAAGNSLPAPEPGDDHLIDALRYALECEQLNRRAVVRRKREVGL
ncbi:MAG: PBSX family phage terminase large subunit [Clostridia bacterium]|nr:PBSX family phage terminase large subunit [Clostridia bacterium]